MSEKPKKLVGKINQVNKKEAIVIDDDEPIIQKQIKTDNVYQIDTEITPWLSTKTALIKHVTIRFHNEIIEFFDYITPSIEEQKKREQALQRVEIFIREILPSVEVQPFGSFRTKLSLPNADIDIVIIDKERSAKELYKIIAQSLINNEKFENVNLIANAKVPIIKFYEAESQFQFDLSFNQFDGLKQLDEINKAFQFYPELKYLLMIMKCVLKQRELHETYSGGIGSFLLFQMILAFLREFRREAKQNQKFDGLKNVTLGEYVMKFLEFYGTKFEYQKKRIFMINGGGIENKPFPDDKFSLISPQDPDHDIGSSSFKIKEIFKIFQNRFNFLQHYNFKPEESVLKYLINPTKNLFIGSQSILINIKELKQKQTIKVQCLIKIWKHIPILFMAFLQKRWTQKYEIPGRMYVIQQIEDIQDQLKIQQLQPLKILLSETRLKSMYDNNQMDCQYIISIMCEEHFKPMMDEYLNKVLINGAMPPLIKFDEYNTIKNQILQLYQTFFYGDSLTQLEKEIEFRYLALKQKKYFKYQVQQRAKDKCVWTHSQQRRVEKMKNWIARDINFYDDLRPIYESLDFSNKIKINEQLMKIDEVSLKDKIFFHLFEKHQFTKSKAKLQRISQTLFTRTMLYTNCLEFLKVLEIPPDFHIELSIINVHIWLICNKLKQINSRESTNLALYLQKSCDRYIQDQVDKIHLRKKQDLVRDIEAYMLTGRRYLDYHFNRNAKTVQNNAYKLDALVWSIIFFEKIPRYSDKVYLIAEYIKSNYDYINNLTYQDFEDCMIEFDIFKVDFDFKTKLLQYNPPLTVQEFEEEFLSDNKIKKYYYSYEENQTIHVPTFESRQKSLLERRLDKLDENVRYLLKKYYNLNTFDHFSSHEEQIKQDKEKQKYIWNKEVERDPEAIKKMIMQRRQQSKS